MKKTSVLFICAITVAAVILSAALSSCAILPTEDEPLAAPLLKPYERRQYTLVAARRDDLVQTKTISCRCRPIREETYSFPVGGIYVGAAYVSVGDYVNAGDMLAELDRKDILAQVEEAKLAVKRQEYELELAEDDSSIRREEYALKSQWQGKPAEYAEHYEKAYADYEFGITYAEKKLEIAESKLDILQEMADERVIYATIDGVVSYAQRFSPGDRSVADEKAYTVSDASELIYSVSGDDAQYFTPGEIYSMKVSKSYIDMLAVSPEEFGELAPNDLVIYFVPVDLTEGLASYGYIVVETKRRDNALYLPASAIIQVGDDKVVYRVGESGFRELTPVETGVTISGKTEILAGLTEGDEVILD